MLARPYGMASQMVLPLFRLSLKRETNENKHKRNCMNVMLLINMNAVQTQQTYVHH